MGIRFQCENCQRKLNVKSHLAGKRGICPHCDARIHIPLESTLTPSQKATTSASARAEQEEPFHQPTASHKEAITTESISLPVESDAAAATRDHVAPESDALDERQATEAASTGESVMSEVDASFSNTPFADSADEPPMNFTERIVDSDSAGSHDRVDPSRKTVVGLPAGTVRIEDSHTMGPDITDEYDSRSFDSSGDSASGKYDYLPTKSSGIHHLNRADRSAVGDQKAPPVPGAVDPIDEAPEKVWYVRPPSGGQYGPAAGHVMRRWLEEGRVSSQAIVWREGWDDWLPATQVFPQLKPATESLATTPAETPPHALPGKPSPEPKMVDESTSKILAYKKQRARSAGCAVAAIVFLSLLVIGLAVLLFVIVFLR